MKLHFTPTCKNPLRRTPSGRWPAGRSALRALPIAAAALAWACSGGVQSKTAAPAAAGEAAPAAQVSAPAPAPAAQVSAPAPVPDANGRQPRTKVFSDIRLSPEAEIQAQKFKCVCGCNLRLARCFCEKHPGAADEKLYLQSLVDKKLSPKEIEDAMVAKFGKEVLP